MKIILIIITITLLGFALNYFIIHRIRRFWMIKDAKDAIQKSVEDGTISKEQGEALEWHILNIK